MLHDYVMARRCFNGALLRNGFASSMVHYYVMARLLAALGSVLRSTGQAIDAFGATVQGGGYIEKRTVGGYDQGGVLYSGAGVDNDGVWRQDTGTWKRGICGTQCGSDGRRDDR